MKLGYVFVAALAACSCLLVTGCASAPAEPEVNPPEVPDEPDEDIAGPEVDTSGAVPTLPPEADEDPFAVDPQLEAEAEAEIDTGIPGDDWEADGERDLGVDPDPEVEAAAARRACKKRVTVIATVGVPGTSKYRTNGCWKVIITDGAARPKDYRKCSTSDFEVHNKKAPSYAYDDTSPSHSFSADTNFLKRCASGSTGVGWEFMAYRSGWRLLGARHLRAYFAELYGSSMTDIDSLFYIRGVYRGNAGLARRKQVYPMINFAPPKSAHLERRVAAETLKICRTVRHRGFVGLYNPSWREGMTAEDPRLRAVERALNACTRR